MKTHYMTIRQFKEDILVYHQNRGGVIEVSFEQVKGDSTSILRATIDGYILCNNGFEEDMVDYFLSFIKSNKLSIEFDSNSWG